MGLNERRRSEDLCGSSSLLSLPSLIFPPGRINEGAWLMTSSRMSLYPARSSRRCCPTSILRPGVIKNGARLSPASSPLPSLCGVPDLSRLIALSVCPPRYWSLQPRSRYRSHPPPECWPLAFFRMTRSLYPRAVITEHGGQLSHISIRRWNDKSSVHHKPQLSKSLKTSSLVFFFFFNTHTYRSSGSAHSNLKVLRGLFFNCWH